MVLCSGYWWWLSIWVICNASVLEVQKMINPTVCPSHITSSSYIMPLPYYIIVLHYAPPILHHHPTLCPSHITSSSYIIPLPYYIIVLHYAPPILHHCPTLCPSHITSTYAYCFHVHATSPYLMVVLNRHCPSADTAP